MAKQQIRAKPNVHEEITERYTQTTVIERPRQEQKRYNLLLPQVVFDEVQTIADAHNMSMAELVKKFIKLGILVAKLEEDPDAALIIREAGKEREVMLL